VARMATALLAVLVLAPVQVIAAPGVTVLEEKLLCPASTGPMDTRCNAEAGLVVTLWSEGDVARIAFNGREVDRGEAIVEARPLIRARGPWVAYWRLTSGQWQLVLRSPDGREVTSGSFPALVGLSEPWSFDFSCDFVAGTVIVGGQKAHLAAIDDGVALAREANWRLGANRSIALGDGRAWHFEVTRGEDDEDGRATVGTIALAGVGPETDRQIDSTEAQSDRLQASADGEGLDIIYTRDERTYLWHDGPGKTEYGPAEDFCLPVYGTDGDHWAAIGEKEGRIVLYVDGEADPTDVVADQAFTLYECLDQGREVVFSIDHGERETLWLWDRGETRQLVDCPGHIQEVAAAQDGSRVYVTCWDEAAGQNQLWDGTGWQRFESYMELRCTPDGRHWIALSDEALLIDGEATDIAAAYYEGDLYVVDDHELRLITVRKGNHYLLRVGLP